MQAIISKILSVIMILVSVIMPAQPNNVEVSVRDITTKSAGLTYDCVNNTGRRIDRPDIKSLEKYVDNEWEEIALPYGRTEIAYFVNPGGDCTESVDFGGLDENFEFYVFYLEEGYYRLTVEYTVFNLFDKGQKGQASATFDVLDADADPQPENIWVDLS